jgi:hypothetical protein
MDPHAPPDLVAALLTAGYRMSGPAGRGGDGAAWSAVALDDHDERVLVRVVDLDADPRHAARLERLRTVAHEHLPELRHVLALPEGRCAVLVEHVAGASLAALGQARGPLRAGEAVTLAVPLADALDALHASGLVHSDVSPANVVLRTDGRPVLIDLLSCVTGAPGTVGFAAPEIAHGEECTPAGDVHALARTILWHLTPDQAPDEQWAGGALVRDLLVAAADPDPDLRPGARDLADACFRAEDPEPVHMPDAAVLAGTELSRLAGRGSRETTERRPARHRARAGWGASTVRVLAGVGAVGACVGVAALVAQHGAATGPSQGQTVSRDAGGAALGTDGTTERDVAAVDDVASDGGSGEGSGSVQPTDPLEAARWLTERRVEVLVAGDPAALEDVEVAGSPAHTADTQLLDALNAAGAHLEGLTIEVVQVEPVSPGPVDEPGGPDLELVSVTSATSAHRRVAADGTVLAEVPASQARSVDLLLSATPGGWRVAEVRAGAVSGS